MKKNQCLRIINFFWHYLYYQANSCTKTVTHTHTCKNRSLDILIMDFFSISFEFDKVKWKNFFFSANVFPWTWLQLSMMMITVFSFFTHHHLPEKKWCWNDLLGFIMMLMNDAVSNFFFQWWILFFIPHIFIYFCVFAFGIYNIC